MSFNIRYGTAEDGPDSWEHRGLGLTQFLARKRPSLLGLQEALRFQIDAILEALPGYRAIGVGREDGLAGGEHSCIVYDAGRFILLKQETFWLSETPSVPGSTHWGNNNVRICTWGLFDDRLSGQRLYHFNTHLDHESEVSRIKSVQLILERISNRPTADPFVLTGDFNVGEASPVIAKVKQGGMKDTFRMIHPRETSVGTFNGFQPEASPDKIDYVFVSDHLHVLDAAILPERTNGRWISDHFAVSALLRR